MFDDPDPPDYEPVTNHKGGPIPLSEAASWIENNPERVASAVKRYFCPHPDQKKVFQGQHFEWFIARSDPSRYTAEDLAAVGTLAVTVPAQTGRILLEDPDGRYRSLLAKCHVAVANQALHAPELSLASCPIEWIESTDSPFVLLYDAVRKLPGVGYVTCSKLIAAKFPALIPIRDGRVEKLLNLQEDRQWWKPMRKLLGSRNVQEVLDGITLPPGSPDVTTLRRLDVALWMEARSRGIGDRESSR